MPRSLFDQDLQVRASGSYDDTIANPHTSGVAEGQTHLEGDLNVMRTLYKALQGESNWYDTPSSTVKTLAEKKFQDCIESSDFADVATGTGGSSIAFDTPVKKISGHADGDGSSTVLGIVLDATSAHKLAIRDHDSQDPIDDGSNNEVYGRLSHSDTIVESGDDNTQVSGYENITGVVDGNTDDSKSLHFSIVDDTGGFWHIDVYKGAARTTLEAHTATYNSMGAKALVADGGSGLGGTITVDALTAADVDIAARWGTYTITWYSVKAGVETAYSFVSSVDVDLNYIVKTVQFKDLAWERFLGFGFHDVAGAVGTVTDDIVIVDGMSNWLVGLTTQAAVNAKVDDLGSTANGEGASGVAIEDASSWFTGTDLEVALNELETLLGSTTSSTFGFTSDNVLADNDAVYAALDKLDIKWGDLASTANAKGASLVGVEDTGTYYTGTDVEAVLQEIGADLANVSGWDKQSETTSAPIPANTDHILPGSMSYTPASGANLDMYYQGGLLLEGASNDYVEVAGSPSTKIQFKFTVPNLRNLSYMARK